MTVLFDVLLVNIAGSVILIMTKPPSRGVTYFSGSSFIPPDDTQHLPTHMFYDKEVFHIALEEVHRMCDIEGKCFVLPIREYVRCKYYTKCQM